MSKPHPPETPEELAARLAHAAERLDAIAATDLGASGAVLGALATIARPVRGRQRAQEEALAVVTAKALCHGRSPGKAAFFAALLRKDRGAWEVMRRLVMPRMAAYARQRGCREALVEDIVQSSLQRFVTRFLNDGRALTTFPDYMLSMVRSDLRDQVRKTGREILLGGDFPDPPVVPGDGELAVAGDLERLLTLVERLSPVEREHLRRRFAEEETHATIGKELFGSSSQNAAQRLNRVLARLRAELEGPPTRSRVDSMTKG